MQQYFTGFKSFLGFCHADKSETRTVLTRRVSSYGLPAALSDYGVNAAGIAEIVVIRRNFSKRQLIGRNAWLICINGDFRQLPATFLLCLAFWESQKSIEFGHMSCRLQPSFPVGTRGHGVPNLILAVGTPCPHYRPARAPVWVRTCPSAGQNKIDYRL